MPWNRIAGLPQRPKPPAELRLPRCLRYARLAERLGSEREMHDVAKVAASLRPSGARRKGF